MHTNTLGVGLGYMKDLETMQGEGREGFAEGCTPMNISDPPSDHEWINTFIDQHTVATWEAALNSILESGLLDEKEEHQDWCKLTGELEYSSCGCWKDHNTLARAIKAHLDELIKSTSI